jgi:hypothetical protein
MPNDNIKQYVTLTRHCLDTPEESAPKSCNQETAARFDGKIIQAVNKQHKREE